MKKRKKSKLFKIFNIKMILLDLAKIIGWLSFVIYFKPKYYYEDKSIQKRRIKGRAIIISNHTWYLDPLFVLFTFFTRRVYHIATIELFKKRFWGFILKCFGCVDINREIADIKAMRKVVDLLREDNVVSIFPEGALEKTEEMTAFKSGVLFFATRTNAPIIPMYIGGKYGLFKRQKAIIGKPIDFTNTDFNMKTDGDQMIKILFDKIKELQNILEDKNNK